MKSMDAGRSTAQSPELADVFAAKVERAASASPEALGAHLGAIADGLRSPLVVAVAGRVNTGKSTLVNSLLGQRVAATGATECTRLVWRFRHGFPERVIVTDSAGSRHEHSLAVDGSVDLERLGPHELIGCVDVVLQNELLKGLVLVDTPGLQSAEEAGEPARALLGIGSDSATAVSAAHAVIFVLGSSFREDDQTFLRDFALSARNRQTNPLNCLCVLGRADLLDSGLDGPLAAGIKLAQKLSSRIGTLTRAVLPACGLAAEAVACGRISSADVATLKELASLAPDQLVLISAAPEVAVDLSLTAAQLRASGELGRLAELLGSAGVHWACAHLRQPGTGPASLFVELSQLSGVSVVREVLSDMVAAGASSLKIDWALANLRRVSAGSQQLSRADVERIVDLIEMTELDEFHALREASAFAEVAGGRLGIPADLADDLRRLCSGGDARQRLGVPEGADPMQWAVGRAAVWRRFVNSAGTTLAQRRIGEVGCRSFELASIELEAGFDGPPA